METAIKCLMKYVCIYTVFGCVYVVHRDGELLVLWSRWPPTRNSPTSCPYDEDWMSEGLGDRASDPFPMREVAEGTPPLHSPAKVWNTVD